MRNKQKKMIGVRLEDEIFYKLKEIADKEEKVISKIVRNLIKQYLKDKGEL